MKKQFINPTLEVVKIKKANIIATSGTCTDNIFCDNKTCPPVCGED